MTASAEEQRISPQPAWLAGVMSVFAVYVYFLIFAQFGFLLLLQSAGSGPDRLKPVMAVMGACGLVASAGVAWVYTAARGRALLVGSMAIAGVAAVIALIARSPLEFFITAALTGLGIGGATVALAPQLRQAIGAAPLGNCIGWGTGLAYGLCNLPVIFQATPRTQSLVALVAAVVGMVAALRFPVTTSPEARRDKPRLSGIALWTVVFLLLVWLDSAAFYMIQHTPRLQGEMWSGDTQLYLNATIHLGVAVLTGRALDRGWDGRIIVLSALFLGVACVLLGAQRSSMATALLYTSGVSIYSTALVFYPASSGRVSIAAIVYGIAGWIGSALGIGMAERWNEIPGWFLATVAGALFVALGAFGAQRRQMNKD